MLRDHLHRLASVRSLAARVARLAHAVPAGISAPRPARAWALAVGVHAALALACWAVAWAA